jgi:ring-1,2-phenylacetyl-CoA epoxidase subunit PaaD
MVTAIVAAPVTEAAIRAALADVTDPEIPTVSVVDLGIVDRIAVRDDEIVIDLLPTFVGCPALEVIRRAVEQRLVAFDRPTRVAFTFSQPWTTERLTEAGRDGLRRAGIAPPTDGPVACPFCGSLRVAMDNLFGPTLCRSLFYCRDCRQPFEAFKQV